MSKNVVSASEAGPNSGMVFSVVPMNENDEQTGEPFTPEFYPDRFNKVMEKELRKNGNQCKGQDVSIKNFKNAKLHATGICLAGEVSVLEALHGHEGFVDLYTPISPNGGIRAYVKKVEVGEMKGWNPNLETWMFNYTIDFVSNGYDEYGGDGENDVVSSYLDTEDSDN